MTPEESRAHYNFLLTLCIRKAESFGPMAFTFVKDRNFRTLGLTPEEEAAIVAFMKTLSDGYVPD